MAEPDPQDPLDAATQATRSLQGLSTELTARVPQLLEAMRSVGTGLELHSTLDRICATAAELAHARYAAIGVVDEAGEGLSDFVTYGVPEEVARAIGRRPDGHHGLLGALIHDPDPVRLADLTGDPRYAGFPPGHPRMRTFLGVPIRVQGEIFGNLYLTEKREGAEFSDYDLHMVRVLATEAGIAIGNARLYEAARQRERWIDGSVAVTTALLSGGDADDALSVVAEQARHLADSAAGIVLLPTAEGGLEIVAVSADDPSSSLGVIIPARSAVVAKLLAGEAVFIDDSATDSRMVTRLAGLFGPSMLLPLQSGGRVLGALATPRARGARPFSRTERTLATQFASQAALALMMAEAQRDRERLAVYEDRDRIARDLHDLAIQRLFATGMTLQSAARLIEHTGAAERVTRAVDDLDETIKIIRSTIFGLRARDDGAGTSLRARASRAVGDAVTSLGFPPRLSMEGLLDTDVPLDVAEHVVAALGELLSNAVRHAHATRVEVSLKATADEVRLTVSDNGRGIPEQSRRSGLANLAERAHQVGGALEMSTPDGGGSRLLWRAPLR
ncbi:GAF domain-containing protein [Streptomyces sp. MBT57]|nr:GAF domain-containing protein [Streptomyces sp. MBT57]